jgi:DNA-binding PadR family transcriptional regulator
MVSTSYRESTEVMPLFLLALISKGGLRTLYDLQQQAALQPGGVQPVLRQLENEGFLTRSEEGKRRRRVMSVTEEGERLLAEQWPACMVFHSDVESVLRAATVALLMEQPHYARGYLLDSAVDYERKSKNLPAAGQNSSRTILDVYISLRTGWETTRLESAAQTLRGIADTLGTSKAVQ